MTAGRKIWIAYAPPGVVSHGPTIIEDIDHLEGEETTVEQYRKMGWEVVHAIRERREHEKRQDRRLAISDRQADMREAPDCS